MSIHYFGKGVVFVFIVYNLFLKEKILAKISIIIAFLVVLDCMHSIVDMQIIHYIEMSTDE
jgi:hypothetical protein